MIDTSAMEQSLVFGLDIGTRNVVGTVGYKMDNEFIVVAQCAVEHETRAMLDGQIHDISRVGRIVNRVKEQLEEQIGVPLTEVCIAAAGRVLKTVTTNITYEYPEETVVTGEAIHTLDLMGIEKAQQILKEKNDTKYKFYCVGYSVVKYYLNDEIFSNLESHKAEKIAEDIIVTFLPEDVVDGLYAAVGQAGLSVANMTLEPIAAINVAIPEHFRLLNIALVDIGAGTSDISVTRDGSIIAYGMIPLAGDEITELIVQKYLVDFKTAEYIKLSSGEMDEITYRDIMLIEHTIPAKEIWELANPVVNRMTTEVAAKIRELNGDKTVSAAFIVGGGGKIHGYTEMLAEKLELPQERVALRGEEVLREVTFEQPDIKKDPLLVTPIGICLNYYDQRNNFIMVRFNGERLKLYDNNRLTVVDAALQAGFPNEDLFPKRGRALAFTVNGVSRIARGEQGESAVVYMNDRVVNINTPLEPNCEITIEPSTEGADARLMLEQLDEASTASMIFVVNGRLIRCPKFLEVNGSLELPSYLIQEGDAVETRNFYTVGQLVQFMDVELDMDREIVVNNRPATLDTLIYENFTIDWTVLSYGAAAVNWEEALSGRNSENATVSESEKTEPAQEAPAGEKQTEEKKPEEPEAAVKEEEAAEPEESAKSEEVSEPEESAKPEEAAEPENSAKPEEPVKPEVPEEKAAEEEADGPAVKAEEEADGSAAKTEEPAEAESQEETKESEETREEEKEPEETAEEPKEQPDASDAIVEEVRSHTGMPEVVIPGMRTPAGVAEQPKEKPVEISVVVYINGEPVHLTGKDRYIFVDIFDFYEFDLSASAGRAIITNLNGQNAQFGAELKTGDQIELGWKEN